MKTMAFIGRHGLSPPPSREESSRLAWILAGSMARTASPIHARDRSGPAGVISAAMREKKGLRSSIPDSQGRRTTTFGLSYRSQDRRESLEGGIEGGIDKPGF